MITFTIEIDDRHGDVSIICRRQVKGPTQAEEQLALQLKELLNSWQRLQADIAGGIYMVGQDREGGFKLLDAVEKKRREAAGN